jgi:hypothetical protein
VPINAINKGNERLLRYLQEPGLMTVRYSDDGLGVVAVAYGHQPRLLQVAQQTFIAFIDSVDRHGLCRAGAGASAKSPPRRLT